MQSIECKGKHFLIISIFLQTTFQLKEEKVLTAWYVFWSCWGNAMWCLCVCKLCCNHTCPLWKNIGKHRPFWRWPDQTNWFLEYLSTCMPRMLFCLGFLDVGELHISVVFTIIIFRLEWEAMCVTETICVSRRASCLLQRNKKYSWNSFRPSAHLPQMAAHLPL